MGRQMTPDLKNEWWLAKQIFGKELCTLFYGVTDSSITKSRMRAEIFKRELQDMIVGKSKTTFAQAYERLYGESLTQKELP
jgi:hypothetical protein